MSKVTVLVVEDNTIMLDGIRDILEMADYQVISALDGQEALDLLKRNSPALIVSDIMMPRMDGYQFFSAVRANPKWFGIPFIFLTAKDQRIDVRLGKQLGADDYLTKPFEPEDLLVAVSAKLERTAALKAVTEAEMAKLKHNILNTLSHEFRTPLTYVHGYLDLILQEGPDELSVEELGDFLQRMKKGSDRLRQLVDDFIFLVMLETGEVLDTFRWKREYFTELGQLIADVIDQQRAQAQAHHVQLEMDIPAFLPGTSLQVEYIKDALIRLLDNAIKFSKEKGGRVVVRATADEKWIYLTVQDEGIGIAAQDMPHLFKRLHQINRELLEQRGIGAGLSIVKGIVELHGGQIQVESQLDQGTTFTMTLPHVEK